MKPLANTLLFTCWKSVAAISYSLPLLLRSAQSSSNSSGKTADVHLMPQPCLYIALSLPHLSGAQSVQKKPHDL